MEKNKLQMDKSAVDTTNTTLIQSGGDRDSYDLLINTCRAGIDGAADYQDIHRVESYESMMPD